MQIGKGKSGVIIGEYGNESDGGGTLGWIEPACDDPMWIAWFTSKGELILHVKRDYADGHTGAIIGEPIRVKAKEGLWLNGKATDHIWCMADGDEPNVIGVRMDCGDSGTVYMTRDQAKDLAEQLTDFVNVVPPKP